MKALDLESLSPKTITSLGMFNCTINLSNTFDLLPMVETEAFKTLVLKYDGMLRDVDTGGVAGKSDFEFKNSITMEIMDKEFDKIRAVKINCRGVHMCGNRSIPRTKELVNFIVQTIEETNSFLQRFVAVGWAEIHKDPFFPTMKQTLLSILPREYTPEDIHALENYCKMVFEGGGLYKMGFDQIPSRNLDQNPSRKRLGLESFRTVMINYGYEPMGFMKTKTITKEEFIKRILTNIDELEEREFDIWLEYDNHISSIGWSGSVPIKFVHRNTGETQWITMQLRRGTIVHSGPNIPIMQRAADLLFKIIV